MAILNFPTLPILIYMPWELSKYFLKTRMKNMKKINYNLISEPYFSPRLNTSKECELKVEVQ